MVSSTRESSPIQKFQNRRDAGRQLALRLTSLRESNPVILGLPRGGVPVAAEVANLLMAPLDVVLVRKLRVPYQPELALGAIGEGGIRVMNDVVLSRCGVEEAELPAIERRERVELERAALLYRAVRTRVPLQDRTVVVVDDGIATGTTAVAACQVVRAAGVKRIVVATPVAPAWSADSLVRSVGELVTVIEPKTFLAVGEWYVDFPQVTEEEVVRLLVKRG